MLPFDLLVALPTFSPINIGLFLTSVLPVAASVLATASAIPQLILLLRARSATGVSIAGWATNTSASAVWIVHSLLNGSTTTALAMAAPAVLTLAVFALAMAWGGDRRGSATPFVFLAVVGAAALTGNPQVFTVILATTVFWSYGPSLFAMWTANDLSGNSTATWAIAALYGVLWGVYGILVADVAVMVNGSINLLLGGAVLTGLVLAKRGIRDEVVATVTGQFTAITTATAQFAIIRPVTAAINVVRPHTDPVTAPMMVIPPSSDIR